MSTPVLLAIVLNLQTSLQGISTGAGYNYTLKPTSVVLDPPQALLTLPPTELPLVVLGHRIEPLKREMLGQGRPATKETWRIYLEAMLEASGLDTARKLTALIDFESDVERAVVSSSWATAGGSTGAMYVYVQQATRYLDIGQQNRCMTVIPVDVLFQRVYGVP